MSSATVSFRVTNALPVRAEASINSDFSGTNIFSEFASADPAIGWAKCVLTGLAANTRYYVRCNYSGSPSTATATFRTPPSGNHSFSFAFASCWTPQGDQNIYPTIKAKADANAIDFFYHLGDMNYADVSESDLTKFTFAMDPVFSVSNQRRDMIASLPFYYMWDDHDSGPDDGDRTNPNRDTAVEWFRKVTPNPPFASATMTESPYYSFKRGRVRFVATDNVKDRNPRTDTDNSSKVMFRAAQDAWFKAQLLDAAANDEPVIWVCTNPWIGAPTTNSSIWAGYSTYRQTLVDFINTNNLNNKIAIISGDMHALAFDDGTNAPAGLRVMQAAPLQGSGSIKGGPYSSGTPVTTRSNQYGVVDVTDATGSGPVSVRFRAYSVGSSSEALEIDQTFSLG